MPAMESQDRNQDTVYWAFSAYDDNGEPKVIAAVDISTRWEQVLQESIGEDGTPIATDGTIFVDRDMAIHGILRLGTIATLPSPVTGGLMEVVGFDKIPDTKGRNYQRTATVRKWKNTMPTVV